MTNAVKKKIAPVIIIAAVLLVIAAAAFKFLTSDRSYRLCGEQITLDTSREMTSEERSADFSRLCAFLEDNLPMLYDYDELYGVKYEDIKARYSELVGSAESDYRYYTLIRGFFDNIPSAHLRTAFPGTASGIRKETAMLDLNQTYQPAQEYWKNVLKTECGNHINDEPESLVFAYYNGEYRGISDSENDVYSVNKGTLLTVDGVPADEFIKIYPLTQKLKYDHVIGKPFRDHIAFNDVFGDKCTIEYLTVNGEKNTAEMYCGTYSLALSEGYRTALFPPEKTADAADKNEPVSYIAERIDCDDVHAFRDTENSVLYLRIDSFYYPNGVFAASVLQNSSMGLDNIIIDIRNNRGGYDSEVMEVLSQLSETEVNIKSDIYVTPSRRLLEGKIFDSRKTADGLYTYPFTMSAEGNCREKKALCLLVSDNTLSAGDIFAAEFKARGTGTVIGTNNTWGERDGLVHIGLAKHSGIAFYYTPYKNINPDGTSNSAYGTSPDIYLNADIDNYFIRREITSSGKDAYSRESQLEWDSVLREAYRTLS